MPESDFIDAGALLPPPSILEKLQLFDQDAPERILKRAEEISVQHRTKEAVSPPRPTDRLNIAFAAAGDSIRLAIVEHMSKNKLDAGIVGLTVNEIKSLRPVLKTGKKDGFSPQP